MIASDATLLQAILDQPSTLAASTARRLSHFIHRGFNPRSEASRETATTLLRAALMSRGVERRIPNLPPINARPIQRPKYFSDAVNLASFGLWFQQNVTRVSAHWDALEEAARADGDRAGQTDEFWAFARCQYDLEVLRNGGQLS